MSVFESADFDEHEHVSFYCDGASGLRAIIAIHSTAPFGVSGGGCRMWPYAGGDEALAYVSRPVPVCADEGAHGVATLAALIGKYDAVNIKLDKAGGLTEALAMAQEAERLGFDIMVGCMVATSLAMAPAMLLAQGARYVDLDGPLLLGRDRTDGLLYEGSRVYPPSSALWG